jgi:hypothetical protein
MRRRIDQNGIPDPLSYEVIESFLKIAIPYRLAMLDFAEAAIPAKTTRDSAFMEAGIVTGRLLLQFLGPGIRRKGGLTLVENRGYRTQNGSTDEVKITDVGGRFVNVASLDGETADALAQFHHGASKASAHFTWDSGHQLDLQNLRRSIPIIRNLVLTHLPSCANAPNQSLEPTAGRRDAQI